MYGACLYLKKSLTFGLRFTFSWVSWILSHCPAAPPQQTTASTPHVWGGPPKASCNSPWSHRSRLNKSAARRGRWRTLQLPRSRARKEGGFWHFSSTLSLYFSLSNGLGENSLPFLDRSTLSWAGGKSGKRVPTLCTKEWGATRDLQIWDLSCAAQFPDRPTLLWEFHWEFL